MTRVDAESDLAPMGNEIGNLHKESTMVANYNVVVVPISAVSHLLSACWASEIQLQPIEDFSGQETARTLFASRAVSSYEAAVHAADDSRWLVATPRYAHAPEVERKLPIAAQLIVNCVLFHRCKAMAQN